MRAFLIYYDYFVFETMKIFYGRRIFPQFSSARDILNSISIAAPKISPGDGKRPVKFYSFLSNRTASIKLAAPDMSSGQKCGKSG